MKSIALICLTFFLQGCISQNNNQTTRNMSEYTGSLQKRGITNYQYGTHTLETEDSFYALKSGTIDLDAYAGERVTLIAEIIKGYPVDNGPVYLNVTKIKP